eukprot:gene11707-4941_t
MQHDVIIIGAGAAGLSAGVALKKINQETLILEARNRVGGRLLTDYEFTSYPIELGGEFIHGDSVITHEFCKQYNIKTKEIVRMPNLFYSPNLSKPAKFYKLLSKEDQLIIEKACEIEKKMLNFEFKKDESFGTFVKRFSDDQKIYESTEVLLAQTCCNSLENLSCYDVKEYLTVHDDEEGESKLLDGYTKLMNHLSEDLNIKLNSVVELIEWNDNGATLHVKQGEETLKYSCKKCIISVPVSILQTDLKFEPKLPKFKQEAINSFEFHPGTKLVYHFDKYLWDETLTYMCHPGTTGRWWIQSHGFETDKPTICCYMTHDRARFIDKLDKEEAVEYGLLDLSKLLGLEECILKNHLLKSKRYSWANEKYTKGAYSTVKVGKENARKDLLQPVGALLFCGEACSIKSNPQTVHGAIDSGLYVENYFKK